ncbi:PIN domain-containing protein [Bosea sp. LjRoot9]|uniref:PIN domain-containing protein n=1 Tax=Bosea sp. LjRoot9 TaxID=3342341 RepID=UPI003ED022ED
MKLKILIDTCVWLDLVKDHRKKPVIQALQDLINDKSIELIMPRVVLDEFERNKERVVKQAEVSAKSHFKTVRDAAERFLTPEAAQATMHALNELDQKIAFKGGAVQESVDLIEKILNAASVVETTDALKTRVFDRALGKKKPFNETKNSTGDAVLIEIYDDAVKARRKRSRDRFAFVTLNHQDFSGLNHQIPHPDLAAIFEPEWSTYSVSIADVLNDIHPDLLEDYIADFNHFEPDRSLSEMLDAVELLRRQIWYNRHIYWMHQIEAGEWQIVDDALYDRSKHGKQSPRSIYEGAKAAARRTEEEVGIENLGPWDDFEWGMLSGKLSALRWVLGDEWDMLDT